MIQKVDFEEVLKKKWSERYEQQRLLFRSTLKYVHTKQIPDCPFKAYFNLQLIENKVPSQINDPETELIKDFNIDEANFLTLENGEQLFKIDISNGLIYEGDDNIDENSDNPVILNTAPICSYHSLIVPFSNSRFQQVLSGYIADQVIGLFKLSTSPFLRLGYNSVLANCSINHLHVHLIYVDQLFDNKRFPVEQFPIKPLQTVNGAILGEVEDYPIRTLVISGESITDLLSVTLDTLLKNNIPHNLMFTSPQLVYIFPRKNQFDFLHEHGMRPAFLELSGLLICRSKQYYDELTLKEINEKLGQLSHPQFEKVIEDIITSFVE